MGFVRVSGGFPGVSFGFRRFPASFLGFPKGFRTFSGVSIVFAGFHRIWCKGFAQGFRFRRSLEVSWGFLQICVGGLPGKGRYYGHCAKSYFCRDLFWSQKTWQIRYRYQWGLPGCHKCVLQLKECVVKKARLAFEITLKLTILSVGIDVSQCDASDQYGHQKRRRNDYKCLFLHGSPDQHQKLRRLFVGTIKWRAPLRCRAGSVQRWGKFNTAVEG